jgi:SAM-dependent methyltransferase
MAASNDPFVQFKNVAREGWSLFAPLETFTMIPAARLVRFARVSPGETVLDVACGTGVVATTAARRGAHVRGLDLSPALIERARQNAAIAGVSIDFVDGDAEALPYADASFDVVLSQFGHMFAPRPEVAIAEMVRVLRPGGRIAFSTWPSELTTGRLFALIAKYLPSPPAGAPTPAAPPLWGDTKIVRERLGDAVTDVVFDRDTMVTPTLSPQHSRTVLETTLGPLVKVVASLSNDPPRLAQLRSELDALLGEIFVENTLRQGYLMTRATKRG